MKVCKLKRKLKRRLGFSMIEMITCTVLMALIVIGVVSSSMAIDSLRVQTRDSVYLSLHNLNVMERLRQDCLDPTNAMLLYYSDQQLGSDTIETQAYLTDSTWDHFHVYKVRVESRIRETRQRLNSEYIITDIGGYAERTGVK